MLGLVSAEGARLTGRVTMVDMMDNRGVQADWFQGGQLTNSLRL